MIQKPCPWCSEQKTVSRDVLAAQVESISAITSRFNTAAITKGNVIKGRLIQTMFLTAP